MASIELVAMTIRLSGLDLKTGTALSSSLTSGWLSGRSLRSEAISSASSMKHTRRSTLPSSDSVSRRALPPSTPCPRSEGWISTNAQESLDAMARANEVFPVPGGPKSRTAAGGTRPSCSASSAWARGATTRRSRISLAEENPFSDSQRFAATTWPPNRSTMASSSGTIEASLR